VKNFRSLLARLGIQLVIGDGEDDVQDDAESEASHEAQRQQGPRRHGRQQTRSHTRRASFNDSNLDTTWISGDRLVNEEEGAQAKSPHRRSRSNARLSVNQGPRSAAPLSAERRHQDLQPPVPAHQELPRKRGESSASILDGVRITRDTANWVQSAHEQHPSLNGYVSESELDDSASLVHKRMMDRAPIPAPSLLFKPSEAELMSDAVAFHSSKVGRNCLHTWHDRALQFRRRRETLEQIAANHDRQILLRQSLATLRDNVYDQGFWEQQERRAGRARDSFLLTKAFTHWAQTASDEVRKTNIVRRHVLSTRYFNAWRDISVVNELKCRRVGLKKFFGIWRTKAERRSLDYDKSTAIHEEDLLQQAYWKLFWTFCDRKAPVWRDSRLKRASLSRLVTTYRRNSMARQLAEDRSLFRAKSNVLHKLVENARSQQAHQASAEDFRRRHLLQGTFRVANAQAHLRPLERQVCSAVERHLVEKAFSTWAVHCQASRHALEVDHQRTLRNAWTKWNDRLRVQTLSKKIDERVIAQAMYKWALEERLRLYVRVADNRVKGRAMHVLLSATSSIQFRLNEATVIFQRNQTTRRMRFGMLSLNRGTRTLEQGERAAAEFRNSRDIRKIVDLWKDKTSHARQLTKWATDARFFCLTTSTLRRWQEATISAKKVKRREAYAVIRRKCKMGLVKNCLQTWSEKIKSIHAIHQQATDQYESKLADIAKTSLAAWSEKSQQIALRNGEAQAYAAQRLLDIAFSALQYELRELQIQDEKAHARVAEESDRSAAKMLKKLGDSIFLLRRQEETAIAWRERRFGQHRRNMLKFWAYQAAQKRALQDIGDPESPSNREVNLFSSMRLPSARNSNGATSASANLTPLDLEVEADLDFGATSRAEEWTQFNFMRNPLPALPENPNSEPRTVATPLPGYLRTPSKRTARTRARFRNIPSQAPPNAVASAFRPEVFDRSVLSSTTPAPLTASGVNDMEALTPQVTPFDRKMRAGGYSQESTTPATAPPGTNRRFGQSRFGRSVGPGFDTGRTVRFGGPTGLVDTPAPHEKSS